MEVLWAHCYSAGPAGEGDPSPLLGERERERSEDEHSCMEIERLIVDLRLTD